MVNYGTLTVFFISSQGLERHLALFAWHLRGSFTVALTRSCPSKARDTGNQLEPSLFFLKKITFLLETSLRYEFRGMKIGRDEHTYWRLDRGAHNRKKLKFLTLGV